MADQRAVLEGIKRLRATFRSHVTFDLEWRRRQITAVLNMLEKRSAVFSSALKADLGRSRMECEVLELQQCISAAKDALANLKTWSAPRPQKVPLLQTKFVSTAVAEPRPLGTVLIIAPWNYPLLLCVNPLIAALAAGNTVVVKPSECSAAMSKAIEDAFAEDLDPSAVLCVTGGPEVSSFLLNDAANAISGWNHIFYTGNGHVGRIVARAAAEHLTPITLELGGKSPVFVASDANVDLAARRIIWGKFTNNGQTCIAPDYILVEAPVAAALVERMVSYVKTFYGEDPKTSSDYGRIINGRHFTRIAGLLEDVRASAGRKGEFLTGGTTDEADRYIAPTLIKMPDSVFGTAVAAGLSEDDAAEAVAAAALDAVKDVHIMNDEIFGPALPIFVVPSLKAAAAFVNARDTPLATYVFGGRAAAKEWLELVSSGGACVNEVLMHFGTSSLPFGGVGPSGTGRSNGKWAFETFSHLRGVLDKATIVDPSLRYPPYTDTKVDLIKRLV